MNSFALQFYARKRVYGGEARACGPPRIVESEVSVNNVRTPARAEPSRDDTREMNMVGERTSLLNGASYGGRDDTERSSAAPGSSSTVVGVTNTPPPHRPPTHHGDGGLGGLGRAGRAVVAAALCLAFVSGIALGVIVSPGGDYGREQGVYSSLKQEEVVEQAPPTVTVGFESSGDFYWLPIVKLLEAALPGVQIKLTDPTYNWRAMGLDKTAGAENLEVLEGDDVDVDLVVEGPNIFKTRCLWADKPWVQTTAEPTMFFNTWDWCEHAQAAMLRLDTGLGHYKNEQVYDEKVTTFVWSPYAMTHTWFLAGHLHGRTARNERQPVMSRPYMLGWVSSNCQDHRDKLFQAMLRGEAARGGVDTVHALGGCQHNKNWSDTETAPPRDLKPWELYANYRWVLAMENSAEPGYLTEKLVYAMASGAIPIYYGDSRAAKKVFKKETYVDVFSVWRQYNHVTEEPPSDADWDVIVNHVYDIDSDPEKFASFVAVEDDALQSYPEVEEDEEFQKGEHYPNEPFPMVRRALGDQTDGNSGNIGEAVEKLRSMFAAKLGQAKRWHEAKDEAEAAKKRSRRPTFALGRKSIA